MSSSSSSNPMPLNEKILKLMESENRPYTLTDIHERIGKQYSKQVVQKCIDIHVANKRFIEKINGKLNIYCFNNKPNVINIEAQKQDLRTFDEKIGKYTKSISEKHARVKLIESQLKKDSNELPLPILQAQHDALDESVNKLQSQTDAMKQRNVTSLNPKDFEKLQQLREKNLQEYRKRKRMCNDLIDGIMEGYPKPKNKLIEDSEIETDEAAGFDINNYK